MCTQQLSEYSNSDHLPASGRIIILDLNKVKLSEIYSISIDEPLFTLHVHEQTIFVSSSCSLKAFHIQEEEDSNSAWKAIKLIEKSKKQYRHTIPIDADYSEGKMLIGDLNMPLCLYEYSSGEISERAGSYLALYPRAVKILENDEFMLSDSNEYLNIFGFKSKKGEDERHILSVHDAIYLGSQCTKICEGTLTKQVPNKALNIQNGKCIIYGCASGEIGVLIPLQEAVYNQIRYLQESMTEVFEQDGDYSYSAKPTYIKKSRTKCQFLDGRIVEKIRSLPEAKVNKIIANINSPDLVNKKELLSIIDRIAKLY